MASEQCHVWVSNGVARALQRMGRDLVSECGQMVTRQSRFPDEPGGKRYRLASNDPLTEEQAEAAGEAGACVRGPGDNGFVLRWNDGLRRWEFWKPQVHAWHVTKGPAAYLANCEWLLAEDPTEPATEEQAETVGQAGACEMVEDPARPLGVGTSHVSGLKDGKAYEVKVQGGDIVSAQEVPRVMVPGTPCDQDDPPAGAVLVGDGKGNRFWAFPGPANTVFVSGVQHSQRVYVNGEEWVPKPPDPVEPRQGAELRRWLVDNPYQGEESPGREAEMRNGVRVRWNAQQACFEILLDGVWKLTSLCVARAIPGKPADGEPWEPPSAAGSGESRRKYTPGERQCVPVGPVTFPAVVARALYRTGVDLIDACGDTWYARHGPEGAPADWERWSPYRLADPDTPLTEGQAAAAYQAGAVLTDADGDSYWLKSGVRRMRNVVGSLLLYSEYHPGGHDLGEDRHWRITGLSPDLEPDGEWVSDREFWEEPKPSDHRAPDPDRDCPHGHQLGKCDTCELAATEAELQLYEQRAQAVQTYIDEKLSYFRRPLNAFVMVTSSGVLDMLETIEKRLRGETP